MCRVILSETAKKNQNTDLMLRASIIAQSSANQVEFMENLIDAMTVTELEIILDMIRDIS
jgi:hypothetical protein